MNLPRRALRAAWRHGGWAALTLARLGRPRTLVQFGTALGDDLLCTAVLRELRRRGERGLWMMTQHPALFAQNPDVDALVPIEERYERLVEWAGGRIRRPFYGVYDREADLEPSPERHIITLMCRAAGITGSIALRPYLTLTEAERAGGRVAPRQVVLHSSGLGARWPMRNKEWFPERFQAVADALRGEYTCIQVGSPSDPPLAGCVDLRGRTTVRETAAVLAASRLFIGQVGFLMHLARAVDRPSVIVFGGRELPWQSGYSCNTNLSTVLPCSPCWRWNSCDHDRACMRSITAEEVIAATLERLARADEPLEVDVDVISDAAAPIASDDRPQAATGRRTPAAASTA